MAQIAGCNRLVINSDNLEAINNRGRLASTTAAVFDDCYFLACDFPITRFKHYNREANRVAHELAKVAKFSTTLNWFEEPLSKIVPLLINDVLVIANE
uniref:RNase H type-1 domain-containing protein n=2 Tax=Triticum aestivum TaxID=4565 RepID=A0A3B6QE99_WHEAT